MNIVVTAGPTREPLDPVRFFSNRSSGRMGYAIAAAALARGHRVVLISGPTALTAPKGSRVVRVMTAEEMRHAVRRFLPWSDALIMAAAVADWRPARCASRKIKKQRGAWTIRLIPTRDILKDVRTLKGNRVYVGFAAETGSLVRHASQKLREKNLDLIVANDVRRKDAGFEVETNQVLLLYGDGRREQWPLMTKAAVARRLIARVEALGKKRIKTRDNR